MNLRMIVNLSFQSYHLTWLNLQDREINKKLCLQKRLSNGHSRQRNNVGSGMGGENLRTHVGNCGFLHIERARGTCGWVGRQGLTILIALRSLEPSLRPLKNHM